MLVVVLLLFVWLKLCIWPVPVAFGSGCAEGSIFLCGGRVSRVAKTIEGLEVEAQRKRGSVKFTRIYGTADSRPSSLALLRRVSPTNHSSDTRLGDRSRAAHFASKVSSSKPTRDSYSSNGIDLRERVFLTSVREGSVLSSWELS